MKKVLNNLRRTRTSASLTDRIRNAAKEEKLNPWNIQVTSSIVSYILKEMGTRDVNDYKQQRWAPTSQTLTNGISIC